MFSDTHHTTGPRLSTAGRLALGLALALAVGLTLVLTAASGGVAADSGNESTVIHEFEESDVRLTNVTYSDGTAYVSLESESREPVTLADAGYGGSGSGQFEVTSLHVDGSETVAIALRGDEAVSVSTPQDGYVHEGQTGVLTVIQHATTAALVQWGVIAGIVGTMLSLMIVVTLLRRSHENTYKELTSEERIRVEKDPVDGFVDNFKRFVSENKRLLLTGAALMFYSALWVLGVVPGPVGIWRGMSDGMRVVTLGSLLATLLALLPVYLLVLRIWEPRKEFVLSIDSRNVIEEALGADGGLAEVIADRLDEDDDEDDDRDGWGLGFALYSGSPDRISEMEFTEGKSTDTRSPGGPSHIVEHFDAKRNRARGTWPGTADDVELIAERSKIDGNREILRDESAMLRALIGALPAIQTASDTGAVRTVDNEFRQLVGIDSSPVDDILGRAAEGTRFEGMYTDETEAQTVEYEEDDEDEDSEEDEQEAS